MSPQRTGYQPRNTPAERRAFFDQQRVTDVLDTRLDALGSQITVTRDETGENFISNKTGAADVDGAIHISIRSAGTEIGRVTRATSTTAGFLTTSDADIKENFASVDDESAKLWMRLIEPYFFNYIGVPDVRHVGYRAQEVAELWPNGVSNGVIVPGHGDVNDRTWDSDGNETTPREVWESWMMDHSKPSPILHAVVRMQDRQITALEATVADQADQIVDLGKQIANLRGEVYYTRQAVMIYDCSTSTAAPPSAGQMRINVTNTQVYVHRNDRGGYDRRAWLDFVVEATRQQLDGVRLRIRGEQGAVYELRTNGIATYTISGTYYTIPVTVIGGAVTKGFDVEVTILSEIWAEDAPPYPSMLPS